MRVSSASKPSQNAKNVPLDGTQNSVLFNDPTHCAVSSSDAGTTQLSFERPSQTNDASSPATHQMDGAGVGIQDLGVEAYTDHVPVRAVVCSTEYPPEMKNTDNNSPAESISETSWLQLQQDSERKKSSCTNGCEMCRNYEHQLQVIQLRNQEKEKQLSSAVSELSVKSHQLEDISSRHTEIERMLETRAHSQLMKLTQLEASMKHLTNRFDSLISSYREHRKATESEITQLQKAREVEQSDFHLLQSHYDSLVGRRTHAAAELIEQPIHLPSDKGDLELLALKLYEDNLALRAAREHLDDRLNGESDSIALKHSGDESNDLRSSRESTHVLRMKLNEAQSQLVSLADVAAQRDTEAALRSRCEEQLKEMRTAHAESMAKVAAKEAELVTARSDIDRLQMRVVCLQNDLNNVESVQADFVRLSQNLQMQLERLRQEETELRWVDPDQVTACYACHAMFSGSNPKKVNCRHCGKVHCPQCLRLFTPLMAPSSRAQPVCDVCHTLLNKHVAPYFSAGIKEDQHHSIKECSPQRQQSPAACLMSSSSPQPFKTEPNW